MERWIGVNLERNGLTGLFRRKSRDLLGVETLKSRLFVQTFCGADLLSGWVSQSRYGAPGLRRPPGFSTDPPAGTLPVRKDGEEFTP